MENRVNVFVGFKIEAESIYTHFWNVLLDFLLVFFYSIFCFFLLDFLFFYRQHFRLFSFKIILHANKYMWRSTILYAVYDSVSFRSFPLKSIQILSNHNCVCIRTNII